MVLFLRLLRTPAQYRTAVSESMYGDTTVTRRDVALHQTGDWRLPFCAVAGSLVSAIR